MLDRTPAYPRFASTRRSATVAPLHWSRWTGRSTGSAFRTSTHRACSPAILDAERGGHFTLRPRQPHEARRRYLPDTNVLETTFTTSTGVVRVTDAMTLPGRALGPARELVRRLEGLSGQCPMTWRVEPRFGYGSAPVQLESRRPYPVATSGSDALAICAWDAGSVQCDAAGMEADFEIREARPRHHRDDHGSRRATGLPGSRPSGGARGRHRRILAKLGGRAHLHRTLERRRGA